MRFNMSGQEVRSFGKRNRYLFIYLSVLLCAGVVTAACTRSPQPTTVTDAISPSGAATQNAKPSTEEAESDTAVKFADDATQKQNPSSPTPAAAVTSASHSDIRTHATTSPTEEETPDANKKIPADADRSASSPTPVPTVMVEAISTEAAVVPGVFAPPSLEEYIFFSDVIAIVRPLSHEASFLAAQNADGETFYGPLIHSRFEVVEYLKGSGEAEIRVDIGRQPFTRSREGALAFAKTELKSQALELDSSESVMFLQVRRYPDEIIVPSTRYSDGEGARSSTLGEGTFHALTAGDIVQGVVGVALLSKYTSGLGFFPLSKDSGGARSFQSIGAASQAEAFTAATNTSFAYTEHSLNFEMPIEFSTKNLRERIETMEALLREGENIEGWEVCIESQLLHKNAQRPMQDILSSVFDIEPSSSGLPAASIIDEFDVTIHRQWFTGDNARLFDYADNRVSTTRPVPAGGYEVQSHFQHVEWEPCDYVPPPTIWRYNFESAEDVLHEAFFDPVALGDAVGADGASGVLKPAAFAFDGNDAAIERIDWLDGQVRMALSPHSALADHHIDFIALDGSIALRLDFDNAVQVADTNGGQTLVWGVCEQPWRAGDLLMLRISESPTDLVGATFNADCAPSAEATPNLMATNTPEPISAPIWDGYATRILVYMQNL